MYIYISPDYSRLLNLRLPATHQEGWKKTDIKCYNDCTNTTHYGFMY